MLEIWTTILSYSASIFGGFLLLSIVVAVHEFGHFIFAKYVGARVDIFSIGFGKAVLKKYWRGTEYRFSWIPLGGYVKIYGQDPDELKADKNPKPEEALCNKSLPGRILVFSGGPVFNLILAAVVFAILSFVGVWIFPSQAMYVGEASPSWKAGLRSGDKIVAVDGKEVENFQELMKSLSDKYGKKVDLKVDREGNLFHSLVPVQETKAPNPYGEWEPVGILKGFSPLGRAPIVGISAKESVWGFHSGDRIKKMNGQAIHSWADLEKYFQLNISNIPPEMTFIVERNGKEIEIRAKTGWIKKDNISSEWGPYRVMQALEIYNMELFIMSVQKAMPAERAGIRPGDRLISANGKLLYNFEDLQNIVEALGKEYEAKEGKKSSVYGSVLRLSLEREGKIHYFTVDVEGVERTKLGGEKFTQYMIGVASQGKKVEPLDSRMVLKRNSNPLSALWAGVTEMAQYSSNTLIGIKKLLFSEISSKAIGGPIMILKVASQSFARSWRSFMKLIAIISIALGIFNLLPIPALDGGHIAFALIEGVRGKPLSSETMEKVMKVGFSLLIMLVLFATYNDIMRVFGLDF